MGDFLYICFMITEKKKLVKDFINDLTIVEIADYFGSLKNAAKVIGYESIINIFGSTKGGAPDFICYDGIRKVVTENFNFGYWTSVNKVVWYNNEQFETNISNLSNMKNTSGNFGLYDILLTNFGGLKIHNGNLTIANGSTIINWDTLEKISGDLVIYERAVSDTLGCLTKVGGKLDIRGFVSDLGNLEFVGGDLIIKNNSLRSLGNLKEVNGRLRIRNSNINDLGCLEKVDGGVLVDKNTPKHLINELKERGISFRK